MEMMNGVMNGVISHDLLQNIIFFHPEKMLEKPVVHFHSDRNPAAPARGGAMAMFTPPPPKTLPPMPVVAPYVSDADTRKKLWELGMRHHLKALEGWGQRERHGFNIIDMI